MDNKLYSELIYLLEELSQDTSVPKNVRKSSTDARNKLSDAKVTLDLRCATAISMLDEIANDPNVPSHGRAALYTIISKLEALSKSGKWFRDIFSKWNLNLFPIKDIHIYLIIILDIDSYDSNRE